MAVRAITGLNLAQVKHQRMYASKEQLWPALLSPNSSKSIKELKTHFLDIGLGSAVSTEARITSLTRESADSTRIAGTLVGLVQDLRQTKKSDAYSKVLREDPFAVQASDTVFENLCWLLDVPSNGIQLSPKLLTQLANLLPFTGATLTDWYNACLELLVCITHDRYNRCEVLRPFGRTVVEYEKGDWKKPDENLVRKGIKQTLRHALKSLLPRQPKKLAQNRLSGGGNISR